VLYLIVLLSSALVFVLIIFHLCALYQVDLHGLCTCIHQLLHLTPLTLCHRETAAQCAQRGLSMSSAVGMIVGGISGIISGGSVMEGMVQELDRGEFTVPQASLKR